MSDDRTDTRESSPLSDSPDIDHQQRLPLRPESPQRAGRFRDSDDSDYPSESPTPRFMQDEAAWKRWKWVPYPVRRTAHTVYRWTAGPAAPRIWQIQPLYPKIQHAPLRLLDRVLPSRRHRIFLFLAYMAAWILTFALVYWKGESASVLGDWGDPTDIGCGLSYWDKNNACGIDGVDCRPFDNSSFAFRCPANCDTYRVLNPWAVGDQEIVYAPVIVGGPSNLSSEENPIYRGDSFICGAAIHSGVVSASQGGCGVVSLIGRQENFVSSNRHGIKSIAFDSYFPLSFTFLPDIECEARDPRWSLLAVSVVFTAVLSLFTTSSAAFFFGTFIITFWQVGLASDKPLTGTFARLFSNLLGKFLPAMFCAWVFYDKMGVRRTLRGLTAQVEKTVLWLGGCWVGALTNYTFDFIPIQRLTGHDLAQQPGAKAALSIIVIVLAVLVIGQIWCFQQEARLVRFLQLYALIIVALLVALALPNLNLRIHHYFLALLLLPGTGIQTRPSLLYQGILVGFFVNGIARWGFDPILQTSMALQGDAQLGSALPVLLPPMIDANLSSITFQWGPPPEIRYDGISILVNDVERFRGFFDDGDDKFVWTRNSNGSRAIKEYFRFAYTQGADVGDYTRAGIWNQELEWVDMPPGPSKLKTRRLGLEEEDVLVTRGLRKQR
ncbi:hypothetical protein F5Y17DRAFT_417683 [Xylariaceae sp. FL0594]|nr:hypothetical protein F5Y17DRAFT_417683 [Xylariaceae sp. FL0594]